MRSLRTHGALHAPPRGPLPAANHHDETEGADPVTNNMVTTIPDEDDHLRLLQGFLREHESDGRA